VNNRRRYVVNPTTNRFEPVTPAAVVATEKETPLPHNQTKEMQRRLRQKAKQLDPALLGALFRPNGEQVPKDWSIYTVGEDVEVKGYMFRVAYIGETNLLLEPVGPVDNDEEDDDDDDE
jgi:hypothetical protein